MSENTNTEYQNHQAEHPWLYKCAVKGCGWEKSQPNNEGALDVQLFGGYGDFIDPYDEEPPYFTLCHKHAHKFANWLNNPEILHPTSGHSHNGAENGFWYGHIGWDQKTWLSHLLTFTWWLFKRRSPRKAWYALKRSIQGHITWTRKDINDSSTPIVWKDFFFKLFFLSNAYAGTVNRWQRTYKTKQFNKAKAIYRSQTSLYNEVWQKAIQGELSDSEKNLLIDIGAALKQQEEE